MIITLCLEILAGKLGSVSANTLLPTDTATSTSFEKSHSKSLHELLTEKVSNSRSKSLHELLREKATKTSQKQRKSRKKSSKKKEKKKKKHHKKRKVKEGSSESSDTDPDATDSATEKPISTSEDEWVEKVVKKQSPKTGIREDLKELSYARTENSIDLSPNRSKPKTFTKQPIDRAHVQDKDSFLSENVAKSNIDNQAKTEHGFMRNKFHVTELKSEPNYDDRKRIITDDNRKFGITARKERLDVHSDSKTEKSDDQWRRPAANLRCGLTSHKSMEFTSTLQSKWTKEKETRQDRRSFKNVNEEKETTDKLRTEDVDRLITSARYGRTNSPEQTRQLNNRAIVQDDEKHQKSMLSTTAIHKNKHFAPDELSFISQLLSKKSKD